MQLKVPADFSMPIFKSAIILALKFYILLHAARSHLRATGHHHGKLLVGEHETPGEPAKLRRHAPLDADGEDVRCRGDHRRDFVVA